MIRGVMAVFAGLLAGVAGMRRARALRQNAARLRRWDALLARLALLLSEAAYTLPEALRQAADQEGEPDAWVRALADHMATDRLAEPEVLLERRPLAEPEGGVLARYLPRLTHGSLAARVQATEQARAEIALLARGAGEVADKDARMWSQLGWIAGACLTILLL